MFWNNGIVVKKGSTEICMDPQNAHTEYDHVLISHAHGDHIASLASKAKHKYTHELTAAIYAATSSRPISNLNAFQYEQRIRIGDFTVTPHNAGHILGSSIFEVDTGSEIVAYTGDLNCVDTVVSKKAEIHPCDTLIIESTYGQPEFIFPARHQIYKRIVEWTLRTLREGRQPVFQVYAVGKAQEIIGALNKFTSIRILTDEKTAKATEVYAKANVNLKAEHFNLDSADVGDSVIHVMAQRNDYGGVNGIPASAIATGWAVKYPYRNTSFPLSSHADFPHLLRFVEHTRPKRVFTCLGFNEDLARAIRRKLGIPATPLPPFAGSGLF